MKSYSKIFMIFSLVLFASLFGSLVFAGSSLSENYSLSSVALTYDLQYRVYLPESYARDDKFSVLYLTDGQWYIEHGNMVETLDYQIKYKKIKPIIVVFVDSRNPDDLTENRRNQEFMCNANYVNFFVKELVPEIDNNFQSNANREGRVIAGISFGGLNAACFGLMAPQTFSGIGMQSPANDKYLNQITKRYREADKKPVKLFFSIGTINDNYEAARKLHRTLVKKGYVVDFIKIRQAHNWKNWRLVMDDMLQSFFKYDLNMDEKIIK